MPSLSSRRRQSPLFIPIALLALLGVLGAPAMARAGASLSHPHALLQLAMEAATGNHHHHGSGSADRHGDPADHGSTGHAHDRAPLRAGNSDSPSDMPTLETAAPGNLSAPLALALVALAFAAVTEECFERGWLMPTRLVGLIFSLDTPPPRLLKAA